MIGVIVKTSAHDRTTPSGCRLHVQIDGPAPAAGSLAEIIRRTRQTVKLIGLVLYQGSSTPNSRKKSEIEEECELYIVAWDKDQARASLELAPPSAQMDLFGGLGRESLEAFLAGLRAISGRSLKANAWPPGFDPQVVEACLNLSGFLDRNLRTITFQGNGEKVVLNGGESDYLRQFLQEKPSPERCCLVGRLETLSGHGPLRGLVWDEDGLRWTCRFKDEHFPFLDQAWMRTVELTGLAATEPGWGRVMEVESIAVPEKDEQPSWVGPGPESGSAQDSDADLNRILALCLADEGPEEMLNYLLAD
ncbi:MAG: hypothetical protein JRJ59_00425 [Deltaproteobacteria bacterium]|nr:hypothetical protein [Deltaproteobacteria bacterium]